MGNVTAATMEYIDPENPNLNPGQVATFDIPLEDQARVTQVARYEITAESSQYAVTPEFPVWTWMLLILAPLEIAIIIRKMKRE
jgi:hypothetical protein